MNPSQEPPPVIHTSEIEPAPKSSRLRALTELFRLPNVFTAMADIFLGFLFTHEALQPQLQFALLLVASCLLYTAGMVLNDVFDREVDAQERPGRPIPSGRISLALAGRIGFGMLLAGVAAAWAAGMLTADARSGLTATALAAAVLAYDWLLKRTPLAPLAMGACRALNVLLGMSLADGPWRPIHLAVAAGLGLYIVGVTGFARTEARQSSRFRLALGTATVVVGILLLGKFPGFLTLDVDPVSVPRFAQAAKGNWQFFWILMAVMVGWRCLLAVIDPAPFRVQAAVRHCLRSLIILDAMVCVGVRGPWIGGMIILLLLPMMFLNRWLYST
ncbi:MAG TPA: UbiA family prenyltransferase [Pirellulales bacterium]|nr:UbiA family prenyltransferase [Pirellulales bacterium]